MRWRLLVCPVACAERARYGFMTRSDLVEVAAVARAAPIGPAILYRYRVASLDRTTPLQAFHFCSRSLSGLVTHSGRCSVTPESSSPRWFPRREARS